MGDSRDIALAQVRSAARILLICPDCGHENAEYAQTLRGKRTFYCVGDDCDYIFDLAPGRRQDFAESFAQACRKFYAALYMARRPLG
jgi:hypothetical protein